MRRGNARLNLLQRPRIPGRWKCTNILQKGGFAAELGTSYSSQRGDSPALFLLEYKAFLPAEFVRVSPNCLDHAPLTRSRADYAPVVRLRGFAWERGNCLRADTRRGGPEDARHSVERCDHPRPVRYQSVVYTFVQLFRFCASGLIASSHPVQSGALEPV
jgi:hypothetical protein